MTGRTLVHEAGDAGFTLIELLVSLVLAALLLAAVPQTFRFSQRSLEAAFALDRSHEADAALTFIEQRLAETTAIYDRGEDGRLRIIFTGESDRITFMCPVAFMAQSSGLARIGLEIAGTGEQGQPDGLTMTWTPWRPVPAGGDPVASPPTQSRLIVAGARALEMRYFGAPVQGEPPVWANNWPRLDTIPDLVELRVVAAGETRVRMVALRLRLP